MLSIEIKITETMLNELFYKYLRLLRVILKNNLAVFCNTDEIKRLSLDTLLSTKNEVTKKIREIFDVGIEENLKEALKLRLEDPQVLSSNIPISLNIPAVILRETENDVLSYLLEGPLNFLIDKLASEKKGIVSHANNK